MQMEAVEIFKAVSSPFLCFFILDGAYVAAGLDFKCGASSCRPRIGMRCHAARMLHFRACRDPPATLFTARSHERAGASRARASPRREVQQSPLPALPRTDRFPRPGRPSSNRGRVQRPEMRTGQPKPSVIPRSQPAGDATPLPA